MRTTHIDEEPTTSTLCLREWNTSPNWSTSDFGVDSSLSDDILFEDDGARNWVWEGNAREGFLGLRPGRDVGQQLATKNPEISEPHTKIQKRGQIAESPAIGMYAEAVETQTWTAMVRGTLQRQTKCELHIIALTCQVRVQAEHSRGGRFSCSTGGVLLRYSKTSSPSPF